MLKQCILFEGMLFVCLFGSGCIWGLNDFPEALLAHNQGQSIYDPVYWEVFSMLIKLYSQRNLESIIKQKSLGNIYFTPDNEDLDQRLE